MQQREILIGLSGGIAAYKTAALVSQLVQAGHAVSVVMTDSARQFIGPTTFEALTGRAVHSKLFQSEEHFKGEHIGLAERAELMVVAPASANTIAKFANGIADDLLSTLALSVAAPILLAPAMNTEMWNKPVTQRNLKQCETDGMQIIPPGSGWLSCGQIGAGRMAEPEEIFMQIEKLLGSIT